MNKWERLVELLKTKYKEDFDYVFNTFNNKFAVNSSSYSINSCDRFTNKPSADIIFQNLEELFMDGDGNYFLENTPESIDEAAQYVIYYYLVKLYAAEIFDAIKNTELTSRNNNGFEAKVSWDITKNRNNIYSLPVHTYYDLRYNEFATSIWLGNDLYDQSSKGQDNGYIWLQFKAIPFNQPWKEGKSFESFYIDYSVQLFGVRYSKGTDLEQYFVNATTTKTFFIKTITRVLKTYIDKIKN